LEPDRSHGSSKRKRKVVTRSLLATYTIMTPAYHLHAPPGFLGWVSQLVRRHRERLLAYARRRGLDAEDALDAVQDSFISFLRLPEAQAIAREGDDSLKLLTVILRHNVQNQTRKRGRRQRAQLAVESELAEEGTESSEMLIANAEVLARVHGCILRMGG